MSTDELPPGDLINVNGQRVHVQRGGIGSPTVVFESALFGNSLSFARVQPEISKITSTLSYDRAGLGYSEPSPNPERISSVIASELFELLTAELKAWGPQLVVISSPNAATAGPTAAREIFMGTPTIVISDGPSKKEARDAIAADGFGYIILPMDPLIGAKREFLDPAEMALFNADALKVLGAGGAVRLVQEELDLAMQSISKGEIELPAILATPEKCAQRMDFQNPYARAKAVGAFYMAQTVATIDAQACFRLKELESIALAAAAGHEVTRAAASLADAARELEKALDTAFSA